MLSKMFRLLRRRTRFPREGVVLMLATFATDNNLSKNIAQKLPKDIIDTLGASNAVETWLLDLWIVNETLVRTNRGLSDEQVQSLVDGFHVESYREFMRRGLSELDITDLQRRLSDRYTEYREGLSVLLQGGERSPFAFSRVVTRNLFGHETSDPVVATIISGCVASAMFAMAEALKEVLPRTKFS